MRLHTLIGLGLMAGAAANGCQAHTGMRQAPSDDVRSDDEDQQPAAELGERLRQHHRGGMTQFFAMSLDTIGPDDEKRPQVERIQVDLLECMAPARELESALLLSVADGVESGAVATAEVDEAIGRLNPATDVMPSCRPDALDRLHAILSPAEREALAVKVESSWEVWRQVNEHEAEEGRGHQPGRMAALTQELRLSTEQIGQISAAVDAARLASPDAFDAKASANRLSAFAAAFAGEAFDAKTASPDGNGRLSTQGAWRMARFYRAVTPLLTAAQRAELAGHLRAHANHQTAISAK